MIDDKLRAIERDSERLAAGDRVVLLRVLGGAIRSIFPPITDAASPARQPIDFQTRAFRRLARRYGFRK